MKIERKVLIKGILKDIKSGDNANGKGKWVLVCLEQGKGSENIFVDDYSILTGKKTSQLIGYTMTLEGELWRNKRKEYNLEYAKMKIVSVKKEENEASEDVPFL